ncbi:MAG TPA: MarR family transcriptional regulator [Pseudonocardia sp.]|jgi:DNA-binding MarR family transcriptional regulator|nr:MarR family transcriptional regulator [Pseudonocardia sp.]
MSSEPVDGSGPHFEVTDPELMETWRGLRSIVTDRLDEYRRMVVEATGLPFSRARALRRLKSGPMTHSELAGALMVDRPAATVAVDDLCARGLVERRPHPTDRRRKLVTLTAEGARVAELVTSIVPPPPPGWREVSAADLAVLRRVVETVSEARRR